MSSGKRSAAKMTDFFQAKSKQKRTDGPKNAMAEQWAAHLGGCRPIYLTTDKQSWVLHVENWMPPSNAKEFKGEWDLHPTKRHQLKLYGKVISEKRWSLMWGISYHYSGATNAALPLTAAGPMVQKLVQTVNTLSTELATTPVTYNAVLQNWYEPQDTISLHADNERKHNPDAPIWSLSWGGTRRFVLRSKTEPSSRTELWLRSGDLVIMGGTCQQTHKHEVPPVRKTMDPPTSNRINWTIRSFRED